MKELKPIFLEAIFIHNKDNHIKQYKMTKKCLLSFVEFVGRWGFELSSVDGEPAEQFLRNNLMEKAA